ILTHAGLQPTFVVGGEVLDLGASASAGAGEWAVVEADEYDRSFLHLRPAIALITNVEPDHLEYYGNVEAMQQAYHQFIARIVPGGALVRNLADPFSRALAAGPERELIDCAVNDVPPHPASAVVPSIRPQPEAPPSNRASLETRAPKHPASAVVPSIRPQPEAPAPQPEAPAPWYAAAIREDGQGSHFTLHHPGGTCPVDLPLSGRHNISNAVQALAAAARAGVAPEIAAEALSWFHGTGRRFQPVGERGGVLVIDDYAHHPTELRATLAAARARYPDRRLVAVFQPHTYSRTVLLFDQFVTAFDAADELIVTAIHAARETDTLGMASEQLVDAIRAHPGAPPTEYLPDLPAIASVLAPRLLPGDLVLTLGAGSITTLGPKLLTEVTRYYDALEK
ncbi:MAG: UDP-N-acetylmuramate--L-alanine ligase, partial [Chloroflexota bacterium]